MWPEDYLVIEALYRNFQEKALGLNNTLVYKTPKGFIVPKRDFIREGVGGGWLQEVELYCLRKSMNYKTLTLDSKYLKAIW